MSAVHHTMPKSRVPACKGNGPARWNWKLSSDWNLVTCGRCIRTARLTNADTTAEVHSNLIARTNAQKAATPEVQVPAKGKVATERKCPGCQVVLKPRVLKRGFTTCLKCRKGTNPAQTKSVTKQADKDRTARAKAKK